MPEIRALRGLRYNLAQIGSLSECIAPPYDVIDADLQSKLYQASPYNIVRLELPKPEPDLYERAGKTLRAWRNEKILQPDPDPAIYVYHQQFDLLGHTFVRRSFMANIRLQPFGQGSIYPHEQTFPKAKEDRLQLLRATQANLSQIFGLYPDPENEIQDFLESKLLGVLGTEAIDHLGVKHSLWPISDLPTIQQLSAMIANKTMFVADGHHRYETACNYRDEVASQYRTQHQLPPSAEFPDDHPANFVLTALVSMHDPGLVVLPTHRLLHGIPDFSTDDLHAKLSPYFDCERVAQGPDSTGAVWAELDRLDEQWILALYSQRSQEWTRISAKQEASDRLEQIAPEYSSAWRELGVSALHRLVLEDALGLKNNPTPTYVHSVQEVIDGLKGKLPNQPPFQLAALVMPATVEQIETLSLLNERMPQKSTYFYPKLISGLVINSLE
jgi:uncharacterized protein (DUF1015 family)